MVKERPNITAAADIAGIDPTTGAIKKSVREINTVMANHDRAKYEIRRSKIQQDLLSTKEDVVAAFEDLDEKYPEFMDSAPFAKQPVITDVTFKAVPKGYYFRSSVIYVEQLKKHVVFLQTIIKGNTSQVFQQYFILLLTKFDIKLETFLGVIMDFSAAQREGFILALKQVFAVKKHNALPFLKGCYMHWMQSVKHISKHRQIVTTNEESEDT